MSRNSAALTTSRRGPWLAILAGGLAAGILDLSSAYIIYGIGVPRAIAGGLLGRGAIHGGAGTYALGVALHFLIATSASAIFYAASRRLYFLTEHYIICGAFYGIAVFLTMNLIVLPLSALHSKGPYQLSALIQGLLVHMICIGLPIAFCVRRFSN